MTRPELTLAREFEAALAWWQAAGVDCDFADDATAWLAEAPLDAPAQTPGQAQQGNRTAGGATVDAAPRIERGAAPPDAANRAEQRSLLGDSPPETLAAFREWWMAAPAVENSRLHPRVLPRGEAQAELMVLVPQPEESDRTRLLEGPQGRLLGRMLAAMGLEEAQVYLAAALPSHTPLADVRAIAAGGMDKVTLHHLALAAPQRLLVLGTGLAAMLGADGGDGLREINHADRKVPVMVSETLEAMLDSPALKARFWRRWMEWSASL